MNRKKREILLRGSSEYDADILYFSGIQIPDPFFAFTLGGKRCALLSPLEAGRASRGSKFDEIFDISEVCARKKMPYSEFSALCSVLKSKKISALSVPENFPSKFYRDLLEAGFDVEVAESPFFCARAIKSEYELGEITRANSAASAGFAIAEEILRLSKINRGRLFFESKPLTCEFLRSEIERAALSLGADSMHTIVAAGNDACDPHFEGSGVVRANSLIVMDIFPRLKKSGYYGDMTRTFLKGEPSAKQARLVETVLDAQAIALSCISEGADGAQIHSHVKDFFAENGFETKASKDGWCGFFHSTGHGVGLDVHEAPSLGARKCILRAGNVVTVEPGLYYRGVGGCRIEDTVAVTKTGARMLSRYHYEWIIP